MSRSRARRRRPFFALALAPTVLLGLAACGGDPITVPGVTAGPAGIGASGSTDGGTENAGSSSSSGSGNTAGGDDGCEADGTTVPAGAGTAKAGDLDGDGKDDRIWLSVQGDESTLGVKTASGAVFSTTYDREDKPPTAVANVLGDGTAIILVDRGFSASLFAVADCAIVTTENVDGEQYSFDLGINGYGTGVGCPVSQNKLYLAGYNLEKATKDGYDKIVRTRIDLSENGSRADNGTLAELGEYAQTSASWKIATGVSCGDAEKATSPE
ncbi:hypothetical protein KIH74_32905 [Kineosporia sp. J2-2]|uniref:Uncharacterized protein n=1 Tax=Kineosporia corallincola TaxID=2835133 RepID=A0ABS5TSN1_9ACTN|nr:hypothetical protein [Kineosporia corallincola]MBT0773792.1 hypothetical protein [Kineosporia corallincola]